MMKNVSCTRVQRRFNVWLLTIALFATMTNVRAGDHSVSPVDGFVPDAATATAIAEAILIPIYGRALIESERPFTANLNDTEWTVVGHLPEGYVGGVALVVIDKSTARIIRVTHGR